MPVEVKICGVKTEEAVAAAIEGGARFIGFVFFPASSRNVTPYTASKLSAIIPKHVARVAVTVDASDDVLKDIIANLKPDYVQLHGSEDIARIQQIRKKFPVKLIKAIKISSADDVAAGRRFQDHVDMLLFDARPPKNDGFMLPGGNGLVFDWKVLQGREFPIPWMLSGGLNASNVGEAVGITGAKIVDVSSSLENKPGEKSPELIREFLNVVKKIK